MILHLQLWHFDAADKEEETISSLLHGDSKSLNKYLEINLSYQFTLYLLELE